MDIDLEYSVTLTGHQWTLVIECLTDSGDIGDHRHGLAVEIAAQVSS